MPAITNGQKIPKNIWILADVHEDELREAVIELAGEGLKLATRLKEELCAVALEGDPKRSTQLFSQVGVDKIYYTKNDRGPDACPDIISSLIDTYTPRLVLVEGSPLGQEVASRVAAKNHIGIVTDCRIIHLNDLGNIEATKMMYGEKVNATFETSAFTPLIVTLKKGSFDLPEKFPRKPAELIYEDIPKMNPPIRKTYYEFIRGDPDKMDLSEAEIIVAVGRGVGGGEGLKVVAQMARALGASLGGTRVAIDQGWLSFEKQIGQTGKTVSPNIFIACGISGAFEFTAGMKDSRNIIAINQDPEAPIFKISDLSLIGDLHRVIPAVVEQLENLSMKGES